jgi:outer membrane protein TolC
MSTLGAAFLVSMGASAGVLAEAPPLTLQTALAAASAPHPQNLIARSGQAAAEADTRIAAARTDLIVALGAGLRRVRPSLDSGDLHPIDDNDLSLAGRKTLYDFGRRDEQLRAARLEVDASGSNLRSVADERRLEIMARFFDVLLADMEYAADNEFMAVAYVKFDHGRDRLRVGKIAEVDLLELERDYQETLIKRNQSLQRRQLSRALLANAMNDPGNLARDLAEPELPAHDYVLPDIARMRAAMLSGNPRLAAQRARVEAARARVEAARREYGPSVDVEFGAARYSRRLNGRDDARLGLVLNIPVYQGDRDDARVLREQADLARESAVLDKLTMELQQALLETYLEVEYLQKTVRNATRRQMEYADKALEKARARYEAELEATLGAAMATALAAHSRERSCDYRLALALERLASLANVSADEFADRHGR